MDRPEHVPVEASCDFSVHRPTTRPFERFVEIADRPLQWTERSGGYWITLDEPTVTAVLNDAGRFSSESIFIPASAKPWPRKLIPEELDPPEHAKFRRLVSRWFSVPVVRSRRDDLAGLAAKHIDALGVDEPCDLVTSLARPVAVRSWSLVVGFDTAETDALVAAHGGITSTDETRRLAAAGELVARIEAVLANRRAHPVDDVPSAVVTGTVDGRELTDTEALDFLFLLVLAGLDTVAATLGFALAALASNWPLHDRIATDPRCRPRAVEELLRRYSVVCTARTVTADTELAGMQLREGDRILVPTCMANLDPALYPEPLELDIDRPPQRQVAFGVGPHRCLGSHLARAIIGAVLDHVGAVRFEPVGDLTACAAGGTIHSMRCLPVQVRQV